MDNNVNNSEVEKGEKSPSANIRDLLIRISQLEDMNRDNREEINECKKVAMETLHEQKGHVAWTKKSIREAFRLAKIPAEERNLMLTQANMILRDSGEGEIDLCTLA